VAPVLSADEFAGRVATASGIDDLGAAGGIVAVEGWRDGLTVPPLVPLVMIAVSDGDAALAAGADVVVSTDELDAVTATAERAPQAAAALAVLLRTGEGRTVADGLQAESAVYGVLQAGEEFARWRASRPPRVRHEPPGPAVVVERHDDVLRVVLSRPHVRNALDRRMRDELAAALQLAVDDPSLTVELSGAGASYSSGGDLDEFGSRPDPATAHLTRLARSLGALVDALGDRVHVTVHGATAGSGVELPAFAGRVTARPDATFELPELALGLIPGAGGTVSLPRRIGRQRTMLLALLGGPIDAVTALGWGLVDAVE
jgi:hypothetical protein